MPIFCEVHGLSLSCTFFSFYGVALRLHLNIAFYIYGLLKIILINDCYYIIGLIQLIYKILNHSNNYVQLISEGTLLIFALHQSIFWPLREFMPKGNLWTLGIALMAIVVLSGLVWLSRRYCPVFIGKWK